MAYFILLIFLASNEATWCDKLYINDRLSSYEDAEKSLELLIEYYKQTLTKLVFNHNQDQDKITSIVDSIIEWVIFRDVDFSLFISSQWFKYYVQADDELRRETILSN